MQNKNKMKANHQICIIFMLIIMSTGESGSPNPKFNLPVAEPHRGPEGCNFPVKWQGNYFQSAVHQTITINRNTISSKGRCVEADGEKYMFFNEKDNCFRCVVFHEKHFNLIQYKETFCVPERASIRKLCSQITGDANLFTMFRLEAAPIDCPFRAPMSFTYSRGNGECRNPVSSIDSCLDSSRLMFNYQACPDVTGTESRAQILQCMATWKEGSYRYLVGLMEYQHHAASYEERFRCFVYEKVKKGSMVGPGLLGPYSSYSNNVIRSSALTFNSSSSSSSSLIAESNSNVLFRVAQSGDASCSGISITPYVIEGSTTMTFRRVQPTKQCYFPSWLQMHPKWHTLDQGTVFYFNSSSMTMVNGSREFGTGSVNIGKDPTSQHFMENTNWAAVCSQIVENPSPDEHMLVLHTTTAQCRNGYICSRIVRRDTHIVEIQMGTLTRQLDDACHPINFDAKQLPYITLTSSNSVKKRCPTLGHFGITSLAQEGRSVRDTCKNGHRSFSVGCSSKNTMEFRVMCNTKARPEIVSEYACLGFWEELGINYLITTSTSRSSSLPRKYCFIYRDMPIPLESKTYQGKLKKYQEDDIEVFRRDDGDFGRVMQFSSIADSCRRDVSPGIEGFLAFNVTSKGRCNDINGSSMSSLLTELWILGILVQIVITMQLQL